MKWISVKRKLPPEDEIVLLARNKRKYGSGEVRQGVLFSGKNGEKFWCLGSDRLHFNEGVDTCHYKVEEKEPSYTHWQKIVLPKDK